jgi:hypothetical protein
MMTIRRRTLLRGAAAVATTASLGLRGVARAAAEPLVINSYGGAFEKFMREEIIPVFGTSVWPRIGWRRCAPRGSTIRLTTC